MIREVFGDLFAADVEALVNPVNTAGVMGKGLAKQFRTRYPDNYDVYRAACERGELTIGQVLATETGQLTNPKWVINFPTKRHWRSASRLDDVAAGLDHLREVLVELGVESVAVPPLGCGLGGLEWTSVRPVIEAELADLSAEVLLFAPGRPPSAAQPASEPGDET